MALGGEALRLVAQAGINRVAPVLYNAVAARRHSRLFYHLLYHIWEQRVYEWGVEKAPQ